MSKEKKNKRVVGQKMGNSYRQTKKSHFKTDNIRKSGFKVSEDEDLFVEDGPTQRKTVDEMSGSDVSDDGSEIEETRKMVTQQNKKKKKSGGFQSMGLSHNVYKGILRKGYKIPTPIQRKTIPLIIDGKDMVAMARTGSGKTAAFLLPMFEKLHTHSAKSGARALILSPTRELAIQTLKFTKELGRFTGLRAAVVLGGDRMDDQFAALHENPDIIIATPGRFMHVVVEMDLKLKSVQYVVFDEADRLFEMGFQEQLHEILNRLPDSRQTLLFSATLPKLLVEFAKAGLHDPTLIRLDVDNKLSDQLKLSFFQCRADDKIAVLLHLLKNAIKEMEQTVVFAATKHHVEYLNMILNAAEIPSTYIYSSLDQAARKINVAKFQYRKVKVMIVTDLAARGIDIPLLDNVINFHFPAKPKLFVHRVGRVARAGRSGTAYSLIAPDEMAYLFDLHVFLGRALKTAPAGGTNKDEDGLYGLVPQSVVDDTAETLISYHQHNFDMESMVKVCKNAYSQYVRSRPAPAPESIKRVKEMESSGKLIGVHPIFGNVSTTDETERLKLLTALKSFKASTTIFEVNSTAKTSAFDVMKKKRGYHERVIQKRSSNREEEAQSGEPVAGSSTGNQEDLNEEELQKAFGSVIGSKRRQSSQDNETPRKRKKMAPVKDEENYLPYRPSDYQSEQGLRLGNRFDKEATGAILDLGGDDDQQIKRKNNSLKWDRKKKKFVRENTDDPKKKKIRTESGAWISASYKSNAYKDWVEKTKRDTVSFEDDDTVDAGEDHNRHRHKYKNKEQKTGKFTVLGTQQKRWHSKGSEKSEQGGNKNKFKQKKSELKNPDQIMKARKQKAKKQAFQKQRHNQKVKRQSVAKQKGQKGHR